MADQKAAAKSQVTQVPKLAVILAAITMDMLADGLKGLLPGLAALTLTGIGCSWRLDLDHDPSRHCAVDIGLKGARQLVE